MLGNEFISSQTLLFDDRCNINAYPVIKWAGGKRQLLPEINKRLPDKFRNYYEPFFGGGALFFALSPKQAVINDFNTQLVNVYKQIKFSPDEVVNYLMEFPNTYNIIYNTSEQTDFYFNKRNDFNKFIIQDVFTAESAALFIFLNKAGYNGLYRVNRRGLFNVPSAHRKILKICEPENIYAVSDLLQTCIIKQGDFEEACKDAVKEDFIFFDSPYYDTFDSYQTGGFSENDHIRLAELFKKLSKIGVFCILTNNDCDFIKHLYADFHIDVISVKRMINCDSKKRTGREVIIKNF